MATFLFAIVALINTVTSQSCIPVNSNNNEEYKSALESLTSMGYTVIEGNLTFLINSSAYGANPSSVYGIYQFNDPSGDIIQTAEIAWKPYSGCDAVLLTGCTPPKMKYFSFVPYIYQRYHPINQTHRNMEILFASLGASLNNLVINSTDYNNWNIAHNTTNNYDSLITVITTADKHTFNDISTQLTKIGLSKTINLNSIPIEYTNFVSPNETDNKQYDSLAVMYRSSLPQNKTQYQSFIHTNQTVYYIQNKQCIDYQPRIPFQPFVRNSTTNYNETEEYLTPFNEYKEKLILYFTQNLSYTLEDEYTFKQLYHEPEYDYGYECIDYDKNCLGDNRDAQYWIMNNSLSDNYFHIDNQSIFIIVGINHHNLNMTLYSNIVLYEIEPIGPVPGPSINNFEYNNSTQILPINNGDINQKYIENMFVIQLARPINCISGLPGFCLNQHQWGNDLKTTFAARDYLNPMSKTRPNHLEIITPIILQFKIV